MFIVSCSINNQIYQNLPTKSNDFSDSVARIEGRVDDRVILYATTFAVNSAQTLTNRHVCIGALSNSADLWIEGEKAQIVKISADYDLCLLAVKHNLKPLAISSKYEIGDEVMVIGFPLGLVKTTTYGTIAALDLVDDRLPKGLQHSLIITAPIAGGNSGSPVIVNGEVVGIVFAGVSEFHHLNFCVGAEFIREFILAT